MTTQQTFDAMFEDKLNTLMPYLVHTAGGNEDLIPTLNGYLIGPPLKRRPDLATECSCLSYF